MTTLREYAPFILLATWTVGTCWLGWVGKVARPGAESTCWALALTSWGIGFVYYMRPTVIKIFED